MAKHRDIFTTEIRTVSDGMAYIRHLVDNGLAYHLEDDPTDILWTTLKRPMPQQLRDMRDRADELYRLGDVWEAHGCPIGYMMDYEATKAGFPNHEAYQEAQGA